MADSYDDWMNKEVAGNFDFIKYNALIRDYIVEIYQIKVEIANDCIDQASAVWLDIPREDRVFLSSLAPTKGGIFTTEERDFIRLNKEFASSAP